MNSQPPKTTAAKTDLSLLRKSFLFGSGLLLYFWFMTLPLVGKAGSATSHARKNFYTVLAILLASILCALFAGLGKRGLYAHGGKFKCGWLLWITFQVLLSVLLLSGAFAV